MTPEKLLAGLNDEQAEAVKQVEGPLLILAGAGSGKTRVLTRRAAYLLAVGAASSTEILCVTFTNKAAREMGERVEALLGPAGHGVVVRTFHSFGLQLLRAGVLDLPVDRNAVVLDTTDQAVIAREVIKAAGIDPDRYAPRELLNAIEKFKQQALLPEDVEPERGAWLGGPALVELYSAYQAALARQHALDFGDLLLWPVVAMRRDAGIAEQIRRRFRYLMVDEYQDTNRIQFDMMAQLAAEHRNLAVVGDDDQSIYAWRGADIANILGFESTYPEARVVRLQQNYRSSPVILEAAWSVVRNNTARRDKKLWTARKDGDLISYAALADERSEAQWAVDKVRRERDRGTPLGEIAIFYRTNAQSRLLEEVLRLRGIPYKVVGNTGFYDRREVKDVLAWLRLLHNPYDWTAFRRIANAPRRGVGDTSIDRVVEVGADGDRTVIDAVRLAVSEGVVGGRPARALGEFADIVGEFRDRAASESVADLAAGLLTAIDYAGHLATEGPDAARERQENVDELLSAMQQYVDRADHPTLGGYLDEVMLVQEGQDEDPGGAVQMMTLHSAKGLEFDAVVIAGLEDGVLPHSRTLDDSPEGLEEERRLFYVGMTRARDRLYMCRARSRRVFGSQRSNPPSRFVRELPLSLLKDDSPDAGSPTRFPFPAPAGTRAGAPAGGRVHPLGRAAPASPGGGSSGTSPPDLPSAWRIGARLRHPSFGVGIVRAAEKGSHGIKLRIEFVDGTKTILPAYVELTPA